MPNALLCPGCGTRYSPRPMGERGERCPVCGGQAARPTEFKRQPVIYWRVVGVAMGMAALVILTLIFALKTWAESRRSSVPAPGMRNQLVLPAPLERPVEDPVPTPDAKPKPEAKPGPTIIESPRMKDEEKKEAVIDTRKTSVLAAAG